MAVIIFQPNGKNSKTEISNQFEKLNKSLEVAPKSTSTAEQPENASLNRDLKALPCKSCHIIYLSQIVP